MTSLTARMTELFQMVRAEINRSNYGNHLSAGMVLSGGGATLRGTLNTAESQTLLPCRLGTPSGIGGRAELVAHPSFATGVGLVQWACRTQAEPVFSVENPLSLLARHPLLDSARMGRNIAFSLERECIQLFYAVSRHFFTGNAVGSDSFFAYNIGNSVLVYTERSLAGQTTGVRVTENKYEQRRLQ